MIAQSVLRRFRRGIRRRFIRRAAVPCNALFGRRSTGTIGILMYHRVTDRCPGVREPTYNVTPPRFRRQLEELLARGFRAWPLRRVLEYGRRGLPIPERIFVVTFDDGYENIYRNAWPVLRELDVPATVFLATGFLDSETPFPFDDWPAKGSGGVTGEAWRPLRTAQCVDMAASGLVDLGAHTHTHADFRTQPRELEEDLSRCVGVIRERFGLTDVTFAFPYGVRRWGFADPALVAAAKRVGVLCGLTAEADLVRPKSDPFEWGRFEVTDADSGPTIAAWLGGWHSLPRQLQGWLQRLKLRGLTTASGR
jgi:peptidoglycan/xylan/chitin deacetylase (PgdA/CDA1 family)